MPNGQSPARRDPPRRAGEATQEGSGRAVRMASLGTAGAGSYAAAWKKVVSLSFQAIGRVSRKSMGKRETMESWEFSS